MNSLAQELLFQAANTPLGIEIETSDREADFKRLSVGRMQKKEFKHLTIRRAAASDKIWIVRLPKPQGEVMLEAVLEDVTLADLDI